MMTLQGTRDDRGVFLPDTFSYSDFAGETSSYARRRRWQAAVRVAASKGLPRPSPDSFMDEGKIRIPVAYTHWPTIAPSWSGPGETRQFFAHIVEKPECVQVHPCRPPELRYLIELQDGSRHTVPAENLYSSRDYIEWAKAEWDAEGHPVHGKNWRQKVSFDGISTRAPSFFFRHKVALGLGLASAALAVWVLLRRKTQGPRSVVAIGDSLTAHGGYVRQLQHLLPAGSTVEGFGFPGQGAAAIHGKLQLALARHPTDVVVLAGVNDIASGRSERHIMEHLEGIYTDARAAGARVVAVQLTPWLGYGNKFDAQLGRTQAAKTVRINRAIATSTTVDAVVSTASLGDPSGLQSQYDAGDHLHLNMSGQSKLGELIFKGGF